MHTVQNLVTTRAPFIRTPLFLGDFEIVGDKSGYFILEKEPPLFQNPPKFWEPDRSIISVT